MFFAAPYLPFLAILSAVRLLRQNTFLARASEGLEGTFFGSKKKQVRFSRFPSFFSSPITLIRIVPWL